MRPASFAALLVLIAGTAESQDAAPTVELSLLCSGARSPEAPVVVTAAPATEHDPGDPVVAIARCGRTTRLELGHSGTWVVGCEASSTDWCPRRTVEVSPHLAVSLEVLPVTRIHGRFALPAAEEPPREVTAQVWLRRPDREVLELTPEVTVEGRDLHFFAPRGELDLRLALDNRVPVYRWGEEVIASTHDLGSIPSRRGGSITGFAIDFERASPAAQATIEVLPSSAGQHRREEERERARQRMHEARTDERGFFQISNLSPGRYSLRAFGRDSISARLEAVEVAESSEWFLPEPLELRLPARLEVAVEPAQHPTEGGWTIMLWPAGDDGLRQVSANDEGLAVLRGVPRGDYRLMVTTEAGTLAHNQTRWIDGDELIQIKLPLRRIRGQLRRGEKPAAHVRVELATGSGSGWRFESDEEGHFGGLVDFPQHGFLFARFESERPPIASRRLLRDGEEFAVDDEGLFLSLDLAGRKARGTVIDSRGEPVAGAKVSAQDGRFGSEAISDAHGRFEILDLPAARLDLTAEHRPSGSSAVQQLDLRTTRSVEGLQLQLTSRQRVGGRLLTATGQPLGGAELQLFAAYPVPGSDQTTSGVDGRFDAELPAGVSRVVVTVLAPHAGLWSGCVGVALGEDETPALEVRVPGAPGGTIEYLARWDSDLPPTVAGTAMLLTEQGGFLPLQTLDRWTSLIDGSAEPAPALDREAESKAVRWPGLTPGSYSLAWSDRPLRELVAHTCGAGAAAEAPWEYLAPGGFVQLVLDHSPYQREQFERYGLQRPAS